ncbi:V-type proton ATPase subunit D-like [Stomoxys calcitrans]|uniref:V-type proton ATPase subunit D n=1 Tax=Stomoxys calcitrans TaxID=35570 RepID=A0A1I8Q6V3_STOCA|nr:V-type proton ATPase subunit D-like [Stomoxys calcitrans]
MSGRDILPITPSRANLVLMKQRIATATNGLNLLKRKRDAMELHLRKILSELKTNQDRVQNVMTEAMFSMAKAKFLAIDLRTASIEQPTRANAFVNLRNQKIVGMNVPSLELMLQPVTSLPLTGLAGGGQQVEVVRTKFQEALKILISLASLEYNANVLREAVKLNNRRVNGLEYVVLPRYHNTLAYIRDELDELEREDFFRLKWSQAKQLQKKSQLAREKEQQSPSQLSLPAVVMDFSDFNIQTHDIKQMGLKGDPSVAVTRKTVVSVSGNKVVLLPEDNIKPVVLGSGKKNATPKPRGEGKSKIKTKSVVTASPSSSEASLS